MRKLIVSSFMSLDGVIDQPWEWIGSYFGEKQVQSSLMQLQQADYFLMPRITYQKFSSTWPGIKGVPYFDRINEMKKIVVSNTLKDAVWNTEVIRGDVSKQLLALKEQDGKAIVKYGVGNLDKVLLEDQLVDEYKFLLIPVIVGKGRRLFENIDLGKVSLRLTKTASYENGVADLHYTPVYPN